MSLKPEDFLEVITSIVDNIQNVGVYPIGHEPGCDCASGFTVEGPGGRAVCHECGAPSEG